MRARGHRVLTPLVSLDTPGKASVQVVILADPDGHEVCAAGGVAWWVPWQWIGREGTTSSPAPSAVRTAATAPQICLVEDEGFRQLSRPDDNAPTLLRRAISLDGSKEWAEGKKGLPPTAAAAVAAASPSKGAAPPAAAALAGSPKPAGK